MGALSRYPGIFRRKIDLDKCRKLLLAYFAYFYSDPRNVPVKWEFRKGSRKFYSDSNAYITAAEFHEKILEYYLDIHMTINFLPFPLFRLNVTTLVTFLLSAYIHFKWICRWTKSKEAMENKREQIMLNELIRTGRCIRVRTYSMNNICWTISCDHFLTRLQYLR